MTRSQTLTLSQPHPLEATWEGSWPICSKERGAGTSQPTASPPTSDLEGVPCLGCCREFGSTSSFFSYRLGGVSVFGGGEERDEPQADPGGAFLCLSALGFKEPVCQDRPPASKGTPDPLSAALRYPPAPRLPQSPRQGYGSALAFQLANALFQTACRFDELIQLAWADCQAVGKEIVALRIKGKGSVFQDVPVTARLARHSLSGRIFRRNLRADVFGSRRDCLCGFAVCVCGIFGTAVFQPRVQFATASGVQGDRGGGDHRPRAAAFRGPISLITSERIFGRSRSSSATRISAPPCATPTSATSRPGRRPRRSARLSSEAMLAALAAKVPFIHWALHPF